MPTYEYKCEECGYKFEQFQTITAKPLHECPECGQDTLNRLIGAGAGIIFKGSGFYQTDYRSESYKKAAESEKIATNKDTGRKKSETKDSTKSDKSKPKNNGTNKTA